MEHTPQTQSHPQHIPVLLHEVLEYLNPEPGDLVIDGTLGQGGHALELLKRIGPKGRLLAFDKDQTNISIAEKKLSDYQDQLTIINDSYSQIERYASANGFNQISSILLDLGFSSLHIDEASRGFSFQQDGPLDMRYDIRQDFTAEEVVNSWRADELTRLFQVYGEEPFARPIAKAIVTARRKNRITTTTQLADLISETVHKKGRIHPATRVFQALRIAVNDELEELEIVLPQLVTLLKPGGRIAIISFHSLEDRSVKRFFKAQHGSALQILTKKPVTPTQKEIKTNPRSRSAKLRAAERI